MPPATPGDPGEERYDAYVGRIARGAGMSLSGQGVGRILNYATQIALAWMYGPAQLGLYALGLTLVQMSNILSQFGMDNGVVRFVAYHQAEGDVPRVRGTILLSLGATFAASVALAAAMYLGAGYLSAGVFGKPSLEATVEVFSLALPFLTLMNMALYATVGFQTVRYQTYVQQVLQPLANFALIVVFYLVGMDILGGAVAYVASTLLGALVALYFLGRLFPGLLASGEPARYEALALLDHSWPLTLSNFTQRINSWTAVLVLGVFGTASAVGIYNAAARTAMLSALVLFAFNGIFSPIISSLYRRGLMGELGRLYADVSRWVFAGGLAIFLLTVLLSKDIMAVLGPEFVPGWVVLVVVAAAQLFNSSVGPTQRVLAMTRHQKVLMAATAGSALVGVAASFALIPGYGILGAAAATATAIVLMNAITLLSVRRLLGFWPYDRRYAKPIAAGVLAAAAVYLVGLAAPVPGGIQALLVFAPLFLVFYAGLLVLLGLGKSDRQLLAALWAPARRAARRIAGRRAGAGRV